MYREGQIDRVYFSLHGAMYVDRLNSGEMFLVKQAGKALGPDIPITLPLRLQQCSAAMLP